MTVFFTIQRIIGTEELADLSLRLRCDQIKTEAI